MSQFPFDFYKYQVIIAIITFVIIAPLLIVSYIFYVKRVLQLNIKGFHITMIVLIGVCYLLNFVENILSILYFKHCETTLSYSKRYYDADQLFQVLAKSASYITHSIFAIKYWILARQVEDIIRNS